MLPSRAYLDNILTHHAGILALRSGQMPWPRFATLHTSNCCNHRCGGCAYGGKLTRDVMTREDHVKVVRDLLDVGVRAFEFCGGGEPTMIPYLPEIFEMIVQANGHFGMITNGGSCFTTRIMEWLVRHATYVRISMETSSIESYVVYTGTSEREYRCVLEHVRELVAYKKEVGSNVDIGLKFAVGRSMNGEDHYRRALQIGTHLGVSNVQFKSLRHEPEELPLESRKIEAAIAQRVAEKFEVPTILNLFTAIEVPQCWLNPLHTVVDYRGDVYLCCYYYYRPDAMRVGNMLKQNFRDLWLSDAHKDLVRHIDRTQCAMVDCKFFRHHATVDQAYRNGRVYFL